MNSNTKICNFAKIVVTIVAIIYNIVIIVGAILVVAPQYYAHEFGKFFVTVISVCWLHVVISVIVVMFFYMICNFFCDIEQIANNSRISLEFYKHYRDND